MTDDEMSERFELMAQQFIGTQKQLAVDEALAGDWERYDWLAGRINRLLWFAGDADA